MSNAGVLFVDDEPHVTAALKRALRREPYRLFSADSAAGGLRLLGEEDIDIVISDEQMPGMSGCEFLAEVRRKYPSVIRMILTGQASMEAAISAINDGEVYRFFTKPCNPADLKATLRQAVLQRRLVTESHRLLDKYREQSAFVEELQKTSPGVLEVRQDHQGAILATNDDESMEELLDEMRVLIGEA
jgi:DNA-binding NtrC family response regulator